MPPRCTKERLFPPSSPLYIENIRRLAGRLEECMKNIDARPLFIFEMANNHMGRVDHAVAIVDALRDATQGFPQFTFAVKLQYRSIPDCIHPDYRDRYDLKFVKRFSE